MENQRSHRDRHGDFCSARPTPCHPSPALKWGVGGEDGAICGFLSPCFSHDTQKYSRYPKRDNPVPSSLSSSILPGSEEAGSRGQKCRDACGVPCSPSEHATQTLDRGLLPVHRPAPLFLDDLCSIYVVQAYFYSDLRLARSSKYSLCTRTNPEPPNINRRPSLGPCPLRWAPRVAPLARCRK